MKTRAALTVGLTLYLGCLWGAAGCSREYRIEHTAYAAAMQLARTTEPGRVAVAATPVDADDAASSVYLRAAKIQRLSSIGGIGGIGGRPFEISPVHVRAPDTLKEREVGRVLLVLGVTSLLGIAGILAYDLAPRQSQNGELPLDHVPLIALAGLPLSLLAVGLTTPGIVLTVRGHRPAGELPAGLPNIRYVSAPGAASP